MADHYQMPSPRYVAAHLLMPAYLKEEGITAVLDAIARGDDAFFIPVWMRAGTRFSPRFLDMTRGDLRIGVMTLPAPREATEAYFAAIVGKPTDPQFARYFLLELSAESPEKGASTVIGEWSDGRHANYGAGPPFTGDLANDRAAFLERVLQHCR